MDAVQVRAIAPKILRIPPQIAFSSRLRCRKGTLPLSIRRLYSVEPPSPPQKPYYITTPIFYVNAAPHVGHLYTVVLADILKRWQVLKGRRAILCSGTDEHGMKVEKAARKEGQEVRAFCDQNVQHFRRLLEKANVSNDHFIRTSDPDHRFAVQHFWLMLNERGYIYESKHEGWYSISDETFYPASQVHMTLDPSTGRKFMASMETGTEVEWTSERNYHFRLSEFKDRLLEYYRANPTFIVPDSRMQDVVQAVSLGLEDLSISRPSERLSWGIPVPNDESQTIYVWLDALINYITKANYPFQIPGQEDAAGWPADCQVIGKDIVRFHAIYWPAFLMALDLAPPKQLLSHAHWTMSRRKMAKSVGNVVNPFFAIDRFGVDVMRYYLALDGGIQDDSDYENAFIVNRYKKGLQGGLGNLVSRVMRGTGWDVRQAVSQSTTGELLPHLGASAEAHRTLLMELPELAAKKMEDLQPGLALREIMNAVYMTNTYMQLHSPWEKDIGEEAQHQIIYLCAESLRICGILLQPYMPEKAGRLLDMIGVAPEARSFENALLGSDLDYGTPTVSLGKGTKGVLFPSIVED
ncbi:methionyl-tRNA synthetase [Agyrium rufum]|nr:methionyl-tRNA synthetase [Agyrium rufum]